MTRTIQRTVARILIASFLFAQMMVAAYACPVISANGAGGTPHANSAFSTAQPAEMPDGCDGPSLDSPNLCVAHCHAGDQNTDAAQIPAVPAGILSSFYLVPPPSESSSITGSTLAEAVSTTSPPHAILHCCFRI